ncbi:hypothetical protein ACTD5D_19115 [Nocardia takedensis]|uniref:hypothetical protein n=1 Tax=Nocardia takedensis TaxID=259390 RepID=UPI0006878259|nr:hypothetical protein [Nocardia takedensis]
MPDATARTEITDWTLSRWLPAGLLGRRWLPIPLWRGLRMQMVHADDVASAVRACVSGRIPGAFDLAAEPVLTAPVLAELLGGLRLPAPRAAISAAAWASWRVGAQPLHPGWIALADRASLLDTTAARRELGWTPCHHARSTCAELVRGMRRHTSGPTPALAPRPLRPGVGPPTHRSQHSR